MYIFSCGFDAVAIHASPFSSHAKEEDYQTKAIILDFKTNPSKFFCIAYQKQDFWACLCRCSNSARGSFLFLSLRSDHAMASPASPAKSVHDFTVKDAKGNAVNLGTYKGKVLLIVNVASQCGLTNSNYTELTQLYSKYKDQGLEILAFPCNQFHSQEPGSNEEIQQFVCARFKAEFPIFDKVDVNGSNAAPLYKYLKSSKGGIFGDGIKWNFSKFVVDKDGKVVDRYAPTTSPLSIEKDIKKLLGTA